MSRGSTPPFGIAPPSFTAFLSPANPVDGWVWGAGPVTQLPTISNKTLGSNVWGLGPSVVVVKLAGPIVAGALANNVFSLGGATGRGGTRYSTFLLEPFFIYNFGGGMLKRAMYGRASVELLRARMMPLDCAFHTE